MLVSKTWTRRCQRVGWGRTKHATQQPVLVLRGCLYAFQWLWPWQLYYRVFSHVASLTDGDFVTSPSFSRFPFSPIGHQALRVFRGEVGSQQMTVVMRCHSETRVNLQYRCTIAAFFESERTGMNGHELEKTCSPNNHCSRHACPNVRTAKRRRAARRFFGAVSNDGWSVGDFRAAVREAEIKPSP